MEIFLQKQKILVTGAGQGIGREIVRKFYREGATVYALTKTEENMKSLLSECPNVKPILVDLLDWDVTAIALEDVQSVNYVVNCAGFDVMDSFMAATLENLESAFAVNVRALNQVCQIMSQKMIRANEGGSIVNICSVLVGSAIFSTYTASKAAVKQLTKNMAVLLGPHGIRVNCISPSFVLTNKVKEWISEPEAAAMAEDYRLRTPLRKFCQVQDVINAVVFVLSDKAQLMTGANLIIDGGLSAK